MSPPAVSVVLPLFNAAHTLAETLDSIAAQTLRDYELIVVDDGSTDDTVALVERRAAADPRIRLLRRPHGGVVAAMNAGIEAARAPLIARMDGDDRMRPQRLALQVAYLRAHPEVDLLGTQVHLFPAERVQGGFREYARWQNACLSPRDIADEIYVVLPIANPTILFRANLIARFGAFRDGDFPEDYEFQLRLLAGGATLAKLPEILLDWRDSAGRLTHVDPRNRREAFDRLRAEFLARDPRLRDGRPLVIWGAARRTRQRVAYLLRQGYARTAWIDIDPRKLGNIIDGARAEAPDWLRERRVFVLVYVNKHGAHGAIGARLRAMGYRRGDDYLMVG